MFPLFACFQEPCSDSAIGSIPSRHGAFEVLIPKLIVHNVLSGFAALPPGASPNNLQGAQGNRSCVARFGRVT
ncbi:urease accessory protein ureg [Moniliophthora roreri]|nr:urease accessory protein ureg [Moniliophthora roreri]